MTIQEIEHHLKQLSEGPTVDDYPLGTFGSDEFGPFGISGITRISMIHQSTEGVVAFRVEVAGRKTFPFYVPSLDPDRFEEEISPDVDALAVSQQHEFLQREVREYDFDLGCQVETLYQALPSELPSALTVSWIESFNLSIEYNPARPGYPSVEDCASSIRERARDVCEVFEDGMLARTKSFQVFVHNLTTPQEETIEELREQRDHLAALLIDATARLDAIATSSQEFMSRMTEETS
jgi:hypothetical protein